MTFCVQDIDIRPWRGDDNLNTSHVNVQSNMLSYQFELASDLNTSHVNVQFVTFDLAIEVFCI